MRGEWKLLINDGWRVTGRERIKKVNDERIESEEERRKRRRIVIKR